METYIAILRGINVGGKTLKMADLRKSLEKRDFKKVSTYIQSGNVFFQYQYEKPAVPEQKIQHAIKNDFGLDVSVIVLTTNKLKNIIAANPFKDDPAKDTSFMHVTFLQSAPENDNRASVLDKKTSGEEVVFSDEAVYLYCPNGYGNSKLSNKLIENKLKVAATTRNWKTTLKLLELVEEG